MRRVLALAVSFAFACSTPPTQNPPENKGLSGTVVIRTGAADEPVANARVAFEASTFSANTDASGRFAFVGMPAGTYDLVVRGDELAARTHVAYAGGAQDLGKVVLGELATLDVTVDTLGKKGDVTIGVEGVGTTTSTGKARFDRLVPGSYRVSAAIGSPALLIAVTTVEAPAGIVTPVALTLADVAEGGKLSGSVRTVDAHGASQVRVSLGGSAQNATTPGDDGSFEMADVPAGIYGLEVTRGTQRIVVPGVAVDGDTTVAVKPLLGPGGASCGLAENPGDSDHDGIGDPCDSCPAIANAGQEDSDGDGIGDACAHAGTTDGGTPDGGGATEDLTPLEILCRDADPLVLDMPVQGSLAPGVGEIAGFSCSINTPGHEAVYKVTLDARTGLNLALGQADRGFVLGLRKDCAHGADLACSRSSPGGTSLSQVLDAGTYFVIVDQTSGGEQGGGSSGLGGPFTLTASTFPAPENGTCAGAELVAPGDFAVTTADSGSESGALFCASQNAGASAFYKVHVPDAKQLEITVTKRTGAAGPIVRVFDGCHATSCLASLENTTFNGGPMTLKWRNPGAARDVTFSIGGAYAGSALGPVDVTVAIVDPPEYLVEDLRCTSSTICSLAVDDAHVVMQGGSDIRWLPASGAGTPTTFFSQGLGAGKVVMHAGEPYWLEATRAGSDAQPSVRKGSFTSTSPASLTSGIPYAKLDSLAIAASGGDVWAFWSSDLGGLGTVDLTAAGTPANFDAALTASYLQPASDGVNVFWTTAGPNGIGMRALTGGPISQFTATSNYSGIPVIRAGKLLWGEANALKIASVTDGEAKDTLAAGAWQGLRAIDADATHAYFVTYTPGQVDVLRRVEIVSKTVEDLFTAPTPTTTVRAVGVNATDYWFIVSDGATGYVYRRAK